MKIPGWTHEPIERHQIGLWIFNGETLCPECSACAEYVAMKPTKFCPACGAEMVNVYEAIAEYNRITEAWAERNGSFD